MNKYLFLTLNIAIFTLLVGCKPKDCVPEDDHGCQEIIIDYNGFESSPQDEFSFEEMSIENDCLLINVRYGGGCGDADFELYLREPLWLPIKPTLEAKLAFDDKDNCEAYLSKQLSFDLTSIQDLPGVSGNEMTLQFTGIGEGKSITYQW